MRSKYRDRGAALLDVAIAMVASMGFASLAVDVAHARVTKIQLQTAADAAARYAVTGLPNSKKATTSPQTGASANKADGTSVTLTAADVELGVWDSPTNTFTVLNGSWLSSATALPAATNCRTS